MLTGFDHIVLVVADVPATIRFYQDLLGMDPREERPGKWALHFGPSKISLQQKGEEPPAATNTLPGSGNFCVLSVEPVSELAKRLELSGIAIETGPAPRIGARGPINSVYFRDPDGNLVEVANPTG